MITTANPTPSSAAASAHASTRPPLELLEARRARDGLATLLRVERSAAADFLLALSEFDRRRGWETLGHASLFAFLNVELGLSKGGAFFRQTAARLLQRFPDVVEPLRDGRLCITTVVELAKVLTETNREELLPRFFGCSSQQAKDVVAALVPVESPPVRAVVTLLAPPKAVQLLGPMTPACASTLMHPPGSSARPVQSTEPDLTHPARVAAPRDDVEPLTADLRRLHVTVSRQLLKKLDAARDGLSHSIPGATAEQVIEAALDLLLEKQAKARGQVKRPRTTIAVAPPRAEAPEEAAAAPQGALPPLALLPTEPPPTDPPTTEPRPPRREGPRETIPAAVRRAVWARDQGRCTWPLDGGGGCGSTHRLELDHIIPWADWGPSTVENLRVVCHRHNAFAARHSYGSRWMARYDASRPGGDAD